MTEPTHDSPDATAPDAAAPDRTDDRADAARADESRDISDVGLPHPGDDARTEAQAADAEPDEAALDEVFPAAEG